MTTELKTTKKLLTSEEIDGILNVRWNSFKFPNTIGRQAKLAIKQEAVLKKIRTPEEQSPHMLDGESLKDANMRLTEIGGFTNVNGWNAALRTIKTIIKTGLRA